MAPRGDGGDDDGFLTRWSRRKREVLAEKDQSRAGAGNATGPLPPACGGEGLGMGGRSEIGSTPTLGGDGLGSPPHSDPPHRKRGEGEEPEMVEPPSLDLVDKDFDVAHWLKQNVPESWKLAAMRRAWESDPAIAGFENPARDYALDWNTPGGAPGYGPLTESDDVEAMVRGIFGEAPKPDPSVETVAEATGDSMPHQNGDYDQSRSDDAAAQQNGSGEATSGNLRLSGVAEPEPNKGEIGAAKPDGVYAAAQNHAPSDPPHLRLRKRGGGATPL